MVSSNPTVYLAVGNKQRQADATRCNMRRQVVVQTRHHMSNFNIITCQLPGPCPASYEIEKGVVENEEKAGTHPALFGCRALGRSVGWSLWGGRADAEVDGRSRLLMR